MAIARLARWRRANGSTLSGLTGEKNGWELGFFAKNVTNKQVEISRVTPVNNVDDTCANWSPLLRPMPSRC